jgi:2-polyprenyl-3-methyl-5-hydroxy-6-metoxy-1,4-benzoquinol methylase
VHVQPNWWKTYFEGVAVTLWLDAVPPAATEREADRIAELLALPSGAGILDVPCGGGRVALALARRGYRLTGVDWSQESLEHARSTDGAAAVTWERRDMRDLPWAARFDGAFCVGNSFGYLEDEENAAFLRAVWHALRPGGRFVLETPMVTENLLHHLQPRPWWKVGDVYLLVENQYDAMRSRLDIEYTYVSNGRVDVRRGSHRAYALKELLDLLTASGFSVELAEPWTREAHMVTFVAMRT